MPFDPVLPPARFVDVSDAELEAKLALLRKQGYVVDRRCVLSVPIGDRNGWRIFYQPLNVVMGLVG